MPIDAIVRTISFILAPVVMITSCILFLNGLLTRYEAVSVRLRSMHRERLELLQDLGNRTSDGKPHAGFDMQRIAEIEEQLPRILHRHKLIRNAVLSINTAILIFVSSMLIIALAALTTSTLTANVALCAFLLGTGALLAGVIVTTLELYRSQHEVAYEVLDGLKLRKEDLQ